MALKIRPSFSRRLRACQCRSGVERYGDIRARAEEEDHARDHISISESSMVSPCRVDVLHKCVRKANFSSVDGAIAGCFDESEVVGVLRVQDYAIESLLSYIRSREVGETKETYLDGVHDHVTSG